jgi:hypothetical protein
VGDEAEQDSQLLADRVIPGTAPAH